MILVRPLGGRGGHRLVHRRIERKPLRIDALEPRGLEFLPELPIRPAPCAWESVSTGTVAWSSASEALQVVEHVEQAPRQRGLGARGQLLALPRDPLPEVVVLGGEPGVPVLERVVLGLEALDGLVGRLGRQAAD